MLLCFIVFPLIAQVIGDQCVTPNNETGECISLYSCSVITTALSAPKNRTIEFLTESNCGGTAQNPLVCCGSASDFKEKKDSTTNVSITKNRIIPDKSYCGFQHSDDYFHSTNETIISEFPWLARILANSRSGNTFYYCSGSLITSKYVLTAANCVKHPEYNPIIVRLGEYYAANDTDCISEDPLFTECSDPVRDLRIVETIGHPNYNRGTQDNDIGLVKMNVSVEFTTYIRPICLPFPGTTLPQVGDVLTTTGWGRLWDEVSLKKRNLHRLISNEDCKKSYGDTQLFNVSKNHMCTKVIDNSNCSQDSGGPLMFAHGIQWQIEGIIGDRAFICEIPSGRHPDFYIRVRNYMDWILQNIKP